MLTAFFILHYNCNKRKFIIKLLYIFLILYYFSIYFSVLQKTRNFFANIYWNKQLLLKFKLFSWISRCFKLETQFPQTQNKITVSADKIIHSITFSMGFSSTHIFLLGEYFFENK